MLQYTKASATLRSKIKRKTMKTNEQSRYDKAYTASKMFCRFLNGEIKRVPQDTEDLILIACTTIELAQEEKRSEEEILKSALIKVFSLGDCLPGFGSLELSTAMSEIFSVDSKKDIYIESIRCKLSHPHTNNNAQEYTGDLLVMMEKVKAILYEKQKVLL